MLRDYLLKLKKNTTLDETDDHF